ncbi:Rna-binding protein cp29b protein, partial [Thalictrum thalictroides]
IGCTRTLQVASLSHVHLVDSLSINVVTNKWRNVRIAASVIQEELAGSVEVESVEEKEVVEELGEVEAEAEAETVVKDEPTINTKLYFGNLPYNCDSAQLAGIIQDYGSPELVEVLYDRATGKSRGFAFVTMSSIEDCNTVIQNLDGSLYGGRPLRVNFSDKPKPKEPLYPETEYKLFVGNLSWSVTSESLTEAFNAYGDVVGARVLYDGETGRSRGYGFVCFNSKEEMEVALTSVNGMVLTPGPFIPFSHNGSK